MQHPYFGEVSIPSDDWQRDVELGGRRVRIWLELEVGVTAAQLDVAARFAQELARFDALARAALATQANDEESDVRTYIDHHVDQVEPEILERVLGRAAREITPGGFVAGMVLANVWLQPDAEEIARFDYGLDPDLRISNYVLKVGFDEKGRVADVAMES